MFIEPFQAWSSCIYSLQPDTRVERNTTYSENQILNIKAITYYLKLFI
jgi:hypothetical protein